MNPKKVQVLLVLALGLVVGGGLVWMLRPSVPDPVAEAAREVAAPGAEDEETDAEHGKTQAIGSGRATPGQDETPERTELDARGEQIGARLAAAEVLVQGPTGAPVADALVEARGDRGVTDQRRTDAAGKTTVLLPACETIAVQASAEGAFPAAIGQHPFGTPLVLVLGEAASVTGVVKDAKGEPVAGAVLEPRGPAGSPRSAQRKRERSDEQGRFKLPPLVPGTYDLWVEPPESRGPVTVVAGMYVPVGPTTRDVELAPGRTLHGKVKDAGTGALLGGAKVDVRVDVKQGQLRNWSVQRQVTTDELGAFTVPALPLGVANVTASAQAHTPATLGVSIAVTDGVEDVELALEAAVALHGRTLSVDSIPVAGAEVVFGWWSNDHLEWSDRKVASDGEGRYELDDLPVRDAAFVCVFKEGLAADAVGLGKLLPGERREVDVRFQKGVEVSGTVRSADGRTVAAAIKLVPRLGAERFSKPYVADTEGAFVLREVAPFAYRLEVVAEGYIPYGKDINLQKNKPTNDLGVITLEKAFELPGVVVRRPGSIGVPAARVSVVPVADKQAPRRNAVTNDFGEFFCQNLKAGTYRIFVDGVGIAQSRDVPVTVTVPAPKAVRVVVDRVDVPPTGGVYGRLLDVGTGQAVTAFTVPGIDGRRIGRGDGSYWITGLPAGRMDLRFDSRGYQSVVVPGVFVRAGDVVKVRDLYLQPGGKLEVLVRDQNGKPIAANEIRLNLTDTQMRTLGHHLQPYDADAGKGLWRYDGLALSNFTLEVQGPKGLQPWKQTFDVLSVDQKRIDVRLQPVPPPKPQPKPNPGKPAPKKDAKPGGTPGQKK